MHRLRTVLLIALFLAPMAVIGPVGGANAAPKVCAGTARMWTSNRLTQSGPPVSTSYGITWVDSTGCPTTSGLLTGNCLSLSGRGAINGRTYYFKSTGTTVTFSGGFEGVLELYREEPILCNGSADTFRLVGALTVS